jgi:hypothetical protein
MLMFALGFVSAIVLNLGIGWLILASARVENPFLERDDWASLNRRRAGIRHGYI